MEAQVQAGGIWVMSTGNYFSFILLDSFHQAITFKVSRGNCSWICSTVYASPIPSTREALWKHLKTARSSFDPPWFLAGDFNQILLPSEVRGGNFIMSRANMFAQVLEECNLVDLGASGNLFKWHRNGNGIRRMAKILDRVVVDCVWRRAFPEAMVENLCRLHSDHNPILIHCGGLPAHARTRPFRFEAAWTTHPEYRPVVLNAWNKGHSGAVLSLAEVKLDSLLFNSEVFGNIFRRKRRIEARLRVSNVAWSK